MDTSNVLERKNQVLLHQSVIGEEAGPMKKHGIKPDVII